MNKQTNVPKIQSFSPTGMTVNGRYTPWQPRDKSVNTVDNKVTSHD